MRIGEDHPFRRQLIHVRRFGLRVALEHVSPVIEIIDRDEQDIELRVWLTRVLGFTGRAGHAEQCNRQKEYRCLLRDLHFRFSFQFL